jgi:hypothetical protein
MNALALRVFFYQIRPNGKRLIIHSNRLDSARPVVAVGTDEAGNTNAYYPTQRADSWVDAPKVILVFPIGAV